MQKEVDGPAMHNGPVSISSAAKPWFVLADLVALCLAVGMISSWITAPAVETWYPTIDKPDWTPPSWLFGPVWTALYIMMAVAAWLVWKKDTRFSGVRLALILFFAQLALNFFWSIFFFGFRSPGLGLAEIAVFLAALILTVIAFFGQSKRAGLLMLPYLAWVSFAAALNFSIWQLN